MSTRVRILGVVTAAAIVAGLFASTHAATAKETGDIVVATVNGDKIYKKDVLEAIKTLPNVKEGDTDKVAPMIIDNMIAEKLLDAETKKEHITDDEEFKKRMELAKAQLTKQVFIEKMLKVKVPDSAIKAEYDKFKKENAGKEEVHARHILLSTEEEAKQVIKDLDSGKKFEDLAKQRSSGPSAQNGGDLGWFAKEGEMVPEFSTAAFALKPGEYTKTPVKTQFGWHVVQVLDRRPRAVPDLNKDLEGAIRNKLGQEAFVSLVKDLRAKAKVEEFDLNGKPVKELSKEEPKEGVAVAPKPEKE